MSLITRNRLCGAILLMVVIAGCAGPEKRSEQDNRDNNAGTSADTEKIANPITPLIKIYVENSGSMYGYVASSTEFKDVIGKIIHDKDFDNVDMDFNFINGDGLAASKDFLDNKNEFEASLSKTGLKFGNTQTSDINGMLNTMLSGANGDTVTILISDGIYDIGSDNYDALKSMGDKTRETVRKILRENNAIQTMVIKMKSQFNGNYCYATKRASTLMNDKRPYYIWLFGKGELLHKYFPDEKVLLWPGYCNHARFQVTNVSEIPFHLSSENRNGSAKIRGNNTLVKCNAIHNVFSYSIIVDYNLLAFSDEYLMDERNYACDNNFKICQINKASEQVKKASGVSDYKRPFVITFETNRTPMGSLNIELKNNKPVWIDATNADNENEIDTEHTFGFSILMEGIIGAYTDISTSCPATFTVFFK